MKSSVLRRQCSLLLCLLLFALFLLTSVFIFAHAEHDCTGEDCVICQQIALCTHHFHTICTKAGTSVCAFASAWLLLPVIALLHTVFMKRTPITEKVKYTS